MTERDWEAAAERRLRKLIYDTVGRMRGAADQIEREAERNIRSAVSSVREFGFEAYPRVAGQVVHTVQTMLFNLPLDSLIDAASDAEAARTEKVAALAERTSETAEADKLAGAVKALVAIREMAKGTAEASAEEDKTMGRRDPKPAEYQEFMLVDILGIVNEAARELGVSLEVE